MKSVPFSYVLRDRVSPTVFKLYPSNFFTSLNIPFTWVMV